MNDDTECEMAFHRWCADELVDPRLYDILEEAFVNGWIAHMVLDGASPRALRLRALKEAVRGPRQ